MQYFLIKFILFFLKKIYIIYNKKLIRIIEILFFMILLSIYAYKKLIYDILQIIIKFIVILILAKF